MCLFACGGRLQKMNELHLLAFAVWLIGWPAFLVYTWQLDRKAGRTYPAHVTRLATVIDVFIWIIVAAIILCNPQ
jgi:hypothetical protein